MTIDTKKLRMLVQDFKLAGSPMFLQTTQMNEILDRLEAAEKERDALRIENEALRAEVIHIKEVEFPRKAQAVADGWRGKCERLEAKIAAMERQEPVGKFIQHPSNGIWEQDGYGDNPDARPLYALPGAQTQGEEK